MTTNSNATTYPLDEGRRVAMQDIKKLMKKKESKKKIMKYRK